MTTQAELRLSPKELSSALQQIYGIRRTPSYVRAIRKYTLARGETLFIADCARVSDLYEWLKVHPDFSRSMARAPAANPGIGFV